MPCRLVHLWRRLAGFARELRGFWRLLGATLLPFASPLGAREVYVFGDSGADMGNYFTLPGLAPHAGAPYFRGADGLLRLSDGPMWPELLYPGMRSAVDPSRTGTLVNFAFGAAQSDDWLPLDPEQEPLPLGTLRQIAAFEAERAAGRLTAGPGSVAFLYAGTNDLFAALGSGEDPANRISAVRQNLQTAATRLADAGIRTVYVSEIADFSHSPAFLQLGLAPEVQKTLDTMTTAARGAIRDGLAETAASLGGRTRIVLLPVNTLFRAVIADPAAFGFTNVTEPIYDDQNERLLVSDPRARAGYFFVDSLHTTARAQALEARFYGGIIDSVEGATQRRFGRILDGTGSAMGLLSRSVAAPRGERTAFSTEKRNWELDLATPFGHERIAGADGEPDARFATGAVVATLRWPKTAVPDLAVSLGYFSQEGNVDSRALRLDQQGLGFSVTNARNFGPVRLDAEVALGWFALETRRDPLGLRQKDYESHGSSHTLASRARLTASHVFPLGRFSLQAKATIDQLRTELRPLTERGTMDLDVRVAKARYDSLRGLLGVDLRGPETVLASWLKFRPELELTGRYELADRGAEVTAELLDNLAGPITAELRNGGRLAGAVEPRLVFPIGGDAALTTAYRYESAGHGSSQSSFWLNLSRRF
ncbi:MAG: SGNH/GDSL hydrolase family protein [Opitutaceae bacterium]